ncbi:MAG: AAA family ATPase [Planctomycetia bacterium]|nr:AAA family ATPase [Planctomycetia bacterium]
MNASEVKQLAAGRWVEVLSAVGGIDAELLDGAHHPCPKCGGDDRFSLAYEADGGLLCRKCFDHGNGDGLAGVQWLLGCTVPEALHKVADYLGTSPNGDGHAKTNGHIGRGAAKRMAKTYPTAAEAVAALESRLGRRSCQWTYHDAKGEPVGVVVRWDTPTGKEIRPVSRIGDGWVIGGMPEPRPLYRLPELMAAPRVFVVEGEPACEAAISIGLVATTSPHGSKSPHKADWRPLAGRDVVLLPDNDDAGRGYRDAVWGILRALDPPAQIRVVELPGLPPAGDIVDWLAIHDAVESETLREQIEAIADKAAEWTPKPKHPPRFIPVTCAELASGDYRVVYLIDGVLVLGQPDYLGGPPKSLKTSIGWDMGISLSTGLRFLDRFEVLRTAKVLYLTGEGGLGFCQDLGHRVCAAKGCRLADLDMVVCDRLPRLDNFEEMAEIGELLTKHSIEVAFFDPVYLGMSGADAGNVMAMGERLAAVNRVCQEVGTTPVLLHHLKRNRELYVPAELTDLAWSGFAEHAGQWQLVSRRARYVPTQFARHELWLSIGGRNGHGGLYGLDVEEGVTGSDTGRYWFAKVIDADDLQRDERAAVESQRTSRAAEQLDADRRAIVAVMAKHDGLETKTQIRSRAAIGHDRFDRAWQSLVDDGACVESDQGIPKGKGQHYRGWVLFKDEGQL